MNRQPNKKTNSERNNHRTTENKRSSKKGGVGKNSVSKPISAKKIFDKKEGEAKPNYRPRSESPSLYKKYPTPKMKEPMPDLNSDKVRLNKYLAHAGVASRREADVLIQAGNVSVNGQVITELGYKVSPTDVVKFDNATLQLERKQYVLLNKPKGFITTMFDPEHRKTVMTLVKKACKERIYPVGRLDKETTGVLLFTNDGDLAKVLIHPRHEIKKIYQVETERPFSHEDLIRLREGLHLPDGFIKCDDANYVQGGKSNQIGVEIHSGKNRIVRRIFEALGYIVVRLDRVEFAGLTKKDLGRGEYRHLSEKEVSFLKMISNKK